MISILLPLLSFKTSKQGKIIIIPMFYHILFLPPSYLLLSSSFKLPNTLEDFNQLKDYNILHDLTAINIHVKKPTAAG